MPAADDPNPLDHIGTGFADHLVDNVPRAVTIGGLQIPDVWQELADAHRALIDGVSTALRGAWSLAQAEFVPPLCALGEALPEDKDRCSAMATWLARGWRVEVMGPMPRDHQWTPMCARHCDAWADGARSLGLDVETRILPLGPGLDLSAGPLDDQ